PGVAGARVREHLVEERLPRGRVQRGAVGDHAVHVEDHGLLRRHGSDDRRRLGRWRGAHLPILARPPLLREVDLPTRGRPCARSTSRRRFDLAGWWPGGWGWGWLGEGRGGRVGGVRGRRWPAKPRSRT